MSTTPNLTASIATSFRTRTGFLTPRPQTCDLRRTRRDRRRRHYARTIVHLHAIELELGAGLAQRRPERPCAQPSRHSTQSTETATFIFDETLPVGPATIEIAFTGILNDQLHGFYRSTFTDVMGVTHVIATTHSSTPTREGLPVLGRTVF